jgi:hypothetical protein
MRNRLTSEVDGGDVEGRGLWRKHKLGTIHPAGSAAVIISHALSARKERAAHANLFSLYAFARNTLQDLAFVRLAQSLPPPTTMDDPLFQTPCLPYDVLVEIIDIFLADLGDDDDQTYSLKLFAFLSRPILVFCQKRLFRKYDVGKVDGRLCRSILAHSPHLIAYVKEVWLYTGPTMPSLSSEEMSTIRKLTSVHHLFVGPRKFALWDCNVPFEELRLITDLLRQPRITSFAVWGEMVPFLPLSKWRHLSAFEVRDENPYANYQDLDPERDSDDDSDVDIEDIYEDFNRLLLFEKALQAPQHSIAIKLRKLCIIDSDKVLVHMLLHPDHVLENECNSSLSPDDPQVDRHDPADDAQHHFDFTQLRSLTADIMPANLLPIWHIIHQAHDHLRTLDIRERYRHKSPKDPFGFNSSTRISATPSALYQIITSQNKQLSCPK